MTVSIDDLPSDPAAVAWVESLLRAPRAGRPALLATLLGRFARIVEKPLPTPGWYDVAHAILLDGSPAVLPMTFDVDGAWKAWRRNGYRGTVAPPAGTLGRIMTIDRAKATETSFFPCTARAPALTRMADGSWLVAERHAHKAKPNVQRWSSDGGEHGFKHGGVIRFDAQRKRVWFLNADPAYRTTSVDHCYAFNVSEQGAWLYGWNGRNFLARLDPERFCPPLRCRSQHADAVATDGQWMLFASGLGGDGHPGLFDLLQLLGQPSHLSSRRMRRLWLARLDLPWPRDWAVLTGQGDTLHMVRGREWHRASIAEAEAQIAPYARRSLRSVPEVSGGARHWST